MYTGTYANGNDGREFEEPHVLLDLNKNKMIRKELWIEQEKTNCCTTSIWWKTFTSSFIRDAFLCRDPKLLKDAAHLRKHLKIQYLWIIELKIYLVQRLVSVHLPDQIQVGIVVDDRLCVLVVGDPTFVQGFLGKND